jgi:hypothetical protein
VLNANYTHQIRPSVCGSEGRPTWRKEMEGARPGSAAQTTGGGGGEVLDC